MKNNSSVKQLLVPLEKHWLNVAMTKVLERQARDMNGVVFDDGPQKDEEISAGIEKMIRSTRPDWSIDKIKLAVEALAQIWFRDKGFFEPLRRECEIYDIGYNSSVKNWTMLCLTFEGFAQIATFIGANQGKVHTAETVFKNFKGEYSLEEVEAILVTMTSLGGVTYENEVYKAAKVIYEDGYKAKYISLIVKDYLKKALLAIAKFKNPGDFDRTIPLEDYKLGKNSKLLKTFFPFSEYTKSLTE